MERDRISSYQRPRDRRATAAPLLAPAAAAVLALQRSAGNQAVARTLARSPAKADLRPRQGWAPEPIPGSFDPDNPKTVEPKKTPGGQGFSGAKMVIDGIRRQLDRVAAEQERAAAISAFMAEEPRAYDLLFQAPGKGMTINLNFAEQDPGEASLLPAPVKSALKVKFVGITSSAPHELPDASEGLALVPGSPGPDAGFGWKGHILSITLRPVRPDPAKAKAGDVIRSVDALLKHLVVVGASWRKIGGQLTRGPRVPVPGAALLGPTKTATAAEVVVNGQKLLVATDVADQAAGAVDVQARRELARDLRVADAALTSRQEQLERSLSAEKSSFGRRFSRTDAGEFKLDPHMLDRARAHFAAAKNYLTGGDLRSADESLSACEDLIDMADAQLYAHDTGDFEGGALADPLRPG